MRDVRALVHAPPYRRYVPAPGAAMTVCERCGAETSEQLEDMGRIVCADCEFINVENVALRQEHHRSESNPVWKRSAQRLSPPHGMRELESFEP
jgi:transcription initiation factor TFIIIB Brf1 subunit/transcription initiation factor TFIIB